MVLIWFLCLYTWENRLLCLNLCCFGKTKVEMLKFAALLAKCLRNNLWKFHRKILNYSENNEIFVGGVFFGRTRYRYYPLIHLICIALSSATAAMSYQLSFNSLGTFVTILLMFDMVFLIPYEVLPIVICELASNDILLSLTYVVCPFCCEGYRRGSLGMQVPGDSKNRAPVKFWGLCPRSQRCLSK